MDIILLHESIPIETRRRVFHDTPSDIQRVVITDEAFIPIRDVKCIIDFGLKRHMLYDFGYDFFRTFYSWKSRKEAIHITERSTHSHVSVYRLYNVDEFEEFYDRNTNQNQSIQKICAYAELLADDENSIVSILQNLYDPVSLVYIYFGIKSLRISNAMDNFGRVTQLGVYVMQLSVPPNLGKMLIHACILQCLDPVITLVSFIINGYLSYLENLKYEHFHYFYDGILSSHVMILKLFEEYQECVCYNRNFGIRYGYSSEDMEIILMTRMKLTRELKEIGIIQNKKQRNLAHANMNATNWPLVQACLVIGHYPKLLHYVKEGCIVLDYCCKKSLSLEGQLKNIISKSSIERCSIVYNILNANLTTCNPTGYTVVPELTAFLFCPKVNGMSNYWMYTSVSKKLYELKKSYEKLVEIRLSYPSIYMAHTEQNILTSIKKLLMLEFNMAALKSPSFDFSCRMRFCHELKHI
ncbi:PREDICTED: probable ATP-dependent RNA helicase YTHDC2 [Nicrophorus vespilloides]|uniref:Probable ATP-dependent RNA helicase YTHDC2 n=1 Tax=Nicrophorus vespilloides TaxID=110193 RepID=A0ABM1MY70_NICVS|nr:PREDICTED: probable ATP-dependent RNA helicase YTHDC2 [Nicrophorus vespilloides]